MSNCRRRVAGCGRAFFPRNKSCRRAPMLGATLALVVVVLGCAPDPTDLVNQLGSPRYALRESAEGELARLGRAALPALRAAKDSKDPEIRTRVTALLARIENSLLLQSTPVSLDF